MPRRLRLNQGRTKLSVSGSVPPKLPIQFLHYFDCESRRGVLSGQADHASECPLPGAKSTSRLYCEMPAYDVIFGCRQVYAGFRLFWRWKSRRRLVRPAVPTEIGWCIFRKFPDIAPRRFDCRFRLYVRSHRPTYVDENFAYFTHARAWESSLTRPAEGPKTGCAVIFLFRSNPLMSNAAIFIFFLTNPLKWRNEQVTLNQRVPGSSPGAPTN